MMNRTPLFRHRLTAALGVLCLLSTDVAAWEPTKTHAGLTEQAALHGQLHQSLRQGLGFDKGLYTLLTIKPDNAPTLFDAAARLDPTHGYTPNPRGVLTAMGWLVLGAVLADTPTDYASNHFYEPNHKAGLLSNAPLGHRLKMRVLAAGSPTLTPGGEPATSWWRSTANPMGLAAFTEQFRRAVAAPTATERQEHLAGSLLAAGAMLHVLQDMGSPSHVRNDLRAHQEPIGSHATDRGSRFERIAALAFGRLGIQNPNTLPKLPSLSAHFTNDGHTGLADVTSRQYFSFGTLPKPFAIGRNQGSRRLQELVNRNLSRPYPKPPEDLDTIAARNPEGATWNDDQGTCLTRYHWSEGTISWFIDDDCALEQLEVLLPKVAGYSASFLANLYRSDVTIKVSNGSILLTEDLVNKTQSSYASASVTVYADTADGSRRSYHQVALGARPAATLAQLPTPPVGTKRITVLLEGGTEDMPLVAAASTAWPQ